MARGKKHIGDVAVAPKNTIGNTTQPPRNSIGDTHPDAAPAPVVNYIDPALGGSGWITHTGSYDWNFGPDSATVTYGHATTVGTKIVVDLTKAGNHDVEIAVSNPADRFGTYPVICTPDFAKTAAGATGSYVTEWTVPNDGIAYTISVNDYGPYDATGTALGGTTTFTAPAELPVAYIA